MATKYLTLAAGGLAYALIYDEPDAIPDGATEINQAWLDARTPPYILGTASAYYYLTVDVSTPGTAFAITAANITLNLNSHTITFDNDSPITITNGSFEAGTGAAASDWDFTNAPHAARFAGVWLSNQIYDGDYSLKFSGYTNATEYVESSGTITLDANTTYSVSAMFFVESWATGELRYVTLVNQGDGDDRTVSKAVAQSRGIQFTETVFTTGASPETYKVQVGCTIPSGATNYKAYIDDVRVQRTRVQAVVAGAASWAPNVNYYPEVKTYGSANNALVTNGTIVQGTGKASRPTGVRCGLGSGARFTDMTITVHGASGANIYCDVSPAEISGNVCYNNVDTIDSRDSLDGSVIFVRYSAADIDDNTIVGGVQNGIVTLSGDGGSVTNNTITLNAKYTNDFAIQVLGQDNLSVYGNTIDNSGVGKSSRGIFVGGTSTGCSVHNNTVITKERAINQEYSGPILGGCYGIQLESCTNTLVYSNSVKVIADDVDAHAFRINGAINADVHDNTFEAELADGATTKAGVVKPAAYDAVDNCLFYDNALITNSFLMFDAAGVHDLVLTRCSITMTGAGTGATTIWSADYDGNNVLDDLVFVDPTYADSTTRTAVEDADVYTSYGVIIDLDSSFLVQYTTTVQCVNGAAAPVAGAAVSIVDENETEVYTGTSDANGQCVVPITHFRTVGSTKTEPSPYTASATKDASAGQETFNATAVQTITITLA